MVEHHIRFIDLEMARVDIFVVSTKLNLNTSPTEDQLRTFNSDYCVIEDNGTVSIPGYVWINRNSFEDDLDHLLESIRRFKLHIRGEILVYVREDGNVTTGRYKVTNRHHPFESVALNISVRKAMGEKAKTLSEQEKLELFRSYWNEKSQPPGRNEVYKGFQIGRYYATMIRNGESFRLIEEIMNERSHENETQTGGRRRGAKGKRGGRGAKEMREVEMEGIQVTNLDDVDISNSSGYVISD